MKKNIAIIAGGDSGEYEISINSAKLVKIHLSEEKYHSYVIVIRADEWYFEASNGDKIAINKHDFSLNDNGRIIHFDVIFNAIHGSPGENGIIQGYFDLLKIPYTSCDLMSSALTFNKSYCNKVVASYGVQLASSIHLFKEDSYSAEEIVKNLKLPLFVKPNAGGSSVGMSRVNKSETLEEAIKIAFAEDDEVLIEEYIPGREISCGVFNFKGKMMAFPITEIITKKDFFDYEAKYTKGISDEVTPADIPEEIDTDCKATSIDLYHRLNCKGVVRFDYIFNQDGIWFLEVNTVPGLSAVSIVPQQAQKFGLSLTELFGMMVENVID